jgi:hypothetical protein
VSVPDAGTRRLLRRIANEHPAGKPMWLTVGEVVAFLDAADALEEAERRAAKAERDLDHTIDERDTAQEWADRLAYAIAPVKEIGEHSNLNNPWANAAAVAAGGGAGPGEEPPDGTVDLMGGVW